MQNSNILKAKLQHFKSTIVGGSARSAAGERVGRRAVSKWVKCKWQTVRRYGKEAGTGECLKHFNNKINKHKRKAAAPHRWLPHTTQIKVQAWSTLTVIAPPFILLELLRGTRDRWVVQESFIIINSTGLAPFPWLSAPPHSPPLAGLGVIPKLRSLPPPLEGADHGGCGVPGGKDRWGERKGDGRMSRDEREKIAVLSSTSWEALTRGAMQWSDSSAPSRTAATPPQPRSTAVSLPSHLFFHCSCTTASGSHWRSPLLPAAWPPQQRGLSDSVSLLPPGFQHQCNKVRG